MRLPASPSKNLMAKPQGRSNLRKAFLQGVLIGLLVVFTWSSFRLWRTRHVRHGVESLSREHSTQEQSSENSRKKLLAFVGVQSGFSKEHATAQYRYELRREILRKTWFPSPRKKLDELEEKEGIRVRFVIGHSNDLTAEFNLQTEIKRYRDVLQLEILEDYLSLPNKIVNYFRYVSATFDVKYIVKIDDDVYFRLDRLPHAIPQWSAKEADYIGCMKRGEVFRKPGFRWREPQFHILGEKYYTHVWGCAYVVSGRAASFISSIPEGSLRFLNNEDTTIGAWMLAFNVTYFDDRRFCSTECKASSLVVYDYPTCAGLCSPQSQLTKLHKNPQCRASPDEIPLLDEIIKVNVARSRKLPPKMHFEETNSV